MSEPDLCDVSPRPGRGDRGDRGDGSGDSIGGRPRPENRLNPGRFRGAGGRWRLLLAAVVVLGVAVSATISYGNPRFNAIAHPMLALGIAVVGEHLLRRWRWRPIRESGEVGG